MQKPILFITHDLYRAGAQMFLLHLMRWIRAHTDQPFELLVAAVNGGEASSPAYHLRQEVEALCPVHWLRSDGRPTNEGAIRDGAYALIYANTCVLGPLLNAIDLGATPVVCHVHELGFSIDTTVGREGFAALARRVDHWVACAGAVRDMLVGVHGIDPSTLDTIPECVPAQALSQTTPDRNAVRDLLAVPRDSFVIVCCGTLCWRKGYDLVTPFMQALLRAFAERPFHLIWVGAAPHRVEAAQLVYELAQSGLNERIRLLDMVTEPAPLLSSGDAFALLSREDPFPLAMIEAAACGLPVVGFDGSGGVCEFVRKGTGVLVPFLDVGLMAWNLAAMAAAPAVHAEMRNASRERALEFDTTRILPHVMRVIETVMGRAGARARG